jgi:outer membrane protein assembly factor BamB
LYVPDWSGNLWCLDAVTGSIIWSRKISDLIFEADPNPYPTVTDNTTLISRTSPAISGGYLVSGLPSALQAPCAWQSFKGTAVCVH